MAILTSVLFVFVGLTTLLVRQALSNSLDASLLATARAIALTIDVERNRIDPDESDRRQLQEIRAAAHAVVVNARGQIVLGETPPPGAPPTRHESLTASRYVGATVRVATVPIRRGTSVYGAVLVWRTDDYVEKAAGTTFVFSMAMALAALLVGLFAASRISQTVVAPINALATLAEGIEERDLGARMRLDQRDELGRLAASFDRMLDRLQLAFEREREFTADASHELRSPLAVLRAEAELALRRDRGAAEYRTALQNVLEEASRLERLVDDLLAVVRADAGAEHRAATDLGTIVRAAGERFGRHAALEGTTIVTNVQAAAAYVHARDIERALAAIIENALSFGSGKIVTMTSGARGQMAFIAVRDEGPGFTEAALRHAGDRFWRDDRSRPRGGTGLGLTIAAALASANGGRLVWRNMPVGAHVALEFPLVAVMQNSETFDSIRP